MQIEPHADLREGAAVLFQMYVAFTQAGFDETQAFELVKAAMNGARGNIT